MHSLNIPESQSTPGIVAEWERGLLSMHGDSYPENSFEFFGQVIEWVDDYLQQSDAPLSLELRLIYMNTSSVKALMDIFDLLEAAFHRGRQVKVVWYYDPRNERVLDLADEFREDCTFPFEITADASA